MEENKNKLHRWEWFAASVIVLLILLSLYSSLTSALRVIDFWAPEYAFTFIISLVAVGLSLVFVKRLKFYIFIPFIIVVAMPVIGYGYTNTYSAWVSERRVNKLEAQNPIDGSVTVTQRDPDSPIVVPSNSVLVSFTQDENTGKSYFLTGDKLNEVDATFGDLLNLGHYPTFSTDGKYFIRTTNSLEPIDIYLLNSATHYQVTIDNKYRGIDPISMLNEDILLISVGGKYKNYALINLKNQSVEYVSETELNTKVASIVGDSNAIALTALPVLSEGIPTTGTSYCDNYTNSADVNISYGYTDYSLGGAFCKKDTKSGKESVIFALGGGTQGITKIYKIYSGFAIGEMYLVTDQGLFLYKKGAYVKITDLKRPDTFIFHRSFK